ncbi:hypothetical protein AJ78_05762 [Emergomyces pasteurianus Ep9510]|uniref:Uncharacterized protein n=1 Tax=Emergomyces pasteurianus Ep9510 TaxID=1447872 RepID=A0A1J9QD04_9EURO|nr:hypothetical protein AJ78_05762 [Emergomyces pasteurianus Ep9510]
MEARTLSQVLQKLSPSAVLDSEDSKREFHRFFLRGAPEQCWKLIPAQYRPSNNANFSLPQLPSTQASSLDQLSSRLPSLRPVLSKEPVLHPPSSLIASNPYQQLAYRENLSSCPTSFSISASSSPYHQPAGRYPLPCPTISSNLSNPGVGMSENDTLPPSNSSHEPQSRPPKKRRRNFDTDKQRKSPVLCQWMELKMAYKNEPLPTTSCKEILGPTKGLIDRSLSTPGRRLYKFITNAEENITNNVFAQHLSLVYSVHEIEYKSLAVVDYAGGNKHITDAYKLIAEEWGCDLEKVKLWWRRGKGYTKLMQEAGPAIIFELDLDVSGLCEHRLRDPQRNLFIKWLQLQKFKENRIKKCRLAAKIILDGLITYGQEDYTYAFLRDAPSRLLDIVRKYLSWEDNGTITPKPLSELLDNPGQPCDQTGDSPSPSQPASPIIYTRLDSLAIAASNLGHSEDQTKSLDREHTLTSSESYNTNMEQSMPSQDYPQSTEEHPTSPFDPPGYMEMGTLPNAGGVEHPAGSFNPNVDDMGHPTPPFDPSSYMEIGSLPYDETGRSNPPFDPSSYMQMGTLPYDDEVGRSTTPFDPSMYMQNGIHANGDFAYQCQANYPLHTP